MNKTIRRSFPTGMLGVLLLLAPVAPLAFTSCDEKEPEINITITVQSDYSGIVDKLSAIEDALNQGFTDNKSAQEMICNTLETMGGSLTEKLAAIEEAVKSQTLSLETKLALIESAVKNGLADSKTQQDLLKEAIDSLTGTLEEKLAAIETALESQTSTLETKLALIEQAVKSGVTTGTTVTEDDLIQKALETLTGTLNERLSAIEDAIRSQTSNLESKLALIEGAVSGGFTNEATALGLIQSAVSSISMDGLSKELSEAIEKVVTALGTIDTTLNDELAKTLSDIFSAVDGLTDFESIIPAILSALEDATKPIPNVERQWVLRSLWDNSYGVYDKYYDFGYTFKNFLVGWESYETPYEAGIYNSSYPYTISLLPNGWVKVSQNEGRYFYIFSEVTETTATAKFYYRDYGYIDEDQRDRYSLDDYGWTTGYIYHFELADPPLPFTWSAHVLRIGDKNYEIHPASYHGILNPDTGKWEYDYDPEPVFWNDILAGGSGADMWVVAINGAGTPEDFEGIDVEGKLVVLQRGGGLMFWEKLKNASEAGALAVICANNMDGMIYSNVSELPSDVKKIPFFTIPKAAGEEMGAFGPAPYYEYQMMWIDAFFATITDPNNLNF